ncbi:MAG: PDZ domain-containing protein [Actinomycetota bacterium]
MRRLGMVVIATALLFAAFSVPIPILYAYLPGPVRDVEQLVEVSEARTYSSEGSLYMTTVSVEKVTLAEAVLSLIDPHTALVSREQVTGGRSLRELQRSQRVQMAASKQHAREVALSALGLGEPSGDGARIVGIVDGSPADGVLAEGDVIASIDDRAVETTCDVGEAIDAVDIGEAIELGLRRDGDLRTVVLETAPNPSDRTASYVGVAMEDVNYRFDPGVEVDFETGRVAGPSAGLMFTLALFDRLTPEDLTGGRRIAGTGTIDCDGGVGPIGGIEQKVAGAEAEGAQVFLAPIANAEDAEAAAGEMEIVPVSTFDDALDYLEGSAP